MDDLQNMPAFKEEQRLCEGWLILGVRVKCIHDGLVLFNSYNNVDPERDRTGGPIKANSIYSLP